MVRCLGALAAAAARSKWCVWVCGVHELDMGGATGRGAALGAKVADEQHSGNKPLSERRRGQRRSSGAVEVAANRWAVEVKRLKRPKALPAPELSRLAASAISDRSPHWAHLRQYTCTAITRATTPWVCRVGCASQSRSSVRCAAQVKLLPYTIRQAVCTTLCAPASVRPTSTASLRGPRLL